MRKIHTFSVSPNMVAPLLAALAILVAASILYGYITILVIIVAYVIHIPFAIRTRRFLAEHPEVWNDKPRNNARRAGPSDGRSPHAPVDDAARPAQAGRVR